MLRDTKLRSDYIKKQSVNNKSKNLTGSIYSISLLVFLTIALLVFYLYLPDTLIWMVGIIVVAAILHFILYFLIALYIDSKKERPFVKQYNEIMEIYEQTDDPQMLYEGLISIKYLPTKTESENAFNLSMSTALHRINRNKEALTYLDKIETTNENLLRIVQEQRKLFKDKK